MSTPSSEPARFDAIIVGAGVGGLYAIYRLRKLGLKVRAFEAAGGVGGTWYWNRYPGCRCDVESMEYSYSFSDELQQEWHWPERYGTQPEILRYINHVADRFDLRRDIEFNTRIKRRSSTATTSTWTVTTDKGSVPQPRASASWRPAISRRRAGRTTLGWRASGASGITRAYGRMKVSISPDCGLGSSAPVRPASSRSRSSPSRRSIFTCFSAPPISACPLATRRSIPHKERAHKAEYPERRRAAFDTPFGIAGYPPPVKSALDAAEAERQRAYEAKWAEGGSISFLYSYTDLLINKESNETASEFVRRKIRATVKDPKTAELLCPNDHPIGTKRLILDTDYYETYNRDNVTLVDIRSKPIEEITPDGLRTADAEYALDAIVFATGFDAMTGAMKEIDIRTDAGMSIREKWEARPAHLSRAHDGRVPESVHDHRPAEPRRQKSDDPGLRAACRLDRRLHAVHARPRVVAHRSGTGRRGCLGPTQQRGRGSHALSAGELMVCRRQHPGETARLHAVCRRRHRL